MIWLRTLLVALVFQFARRRAANHQRAGRYHLLRSAVWTDRADRLNEQSKLSNPKPMGD